MTANMSTLIQGVARITPSATSHSTEAPYSKVVTARTERKALSRICHLLPFSATLLIGNLRLPSAPSPMMSSYYVSTEDKLRDSHD